MEFISPPEPVFPLPYLDSIYKTAGSTDGDVICRYGVLLTNKVLLEECIRVATNKKAALKTNLI